MVVTVEGGEKGGVLAKPDGSLTGHHDGECPVFCWHIFGIGSALTQAPNFPLSSSILVLHTIAYIKGARDPVKYSSSTAANAIVQVSSGHRLEYPQRLGVVRSMVHESIA